MVGGCVGGGVYAGVVTGELVVSSGDGLAFEDGGDRGRILVSSESTGGAYSVMEWTVAARVDDELVGVRCASS